MDIYKHPHSRNRVDETIKTGKSSTPKKSEKTAKDVLKDRFNEKFYGTDIKRRESGKKAYKRAKRKMIEEMLNYPKIKTTRNESLTIKRPLSPLRFSDGIPSLFPSPKTSILSTLPSRQYQQCKFIRNCDDGNEVRHRHPQKSINIENKNNNNDGKENGNVKGPLLKTVPLTVSKRNNPIETKPQKKIENLPPVSSVPRTYAQIAKRKDEIKMAQTLDVMSNLLDIMIDSAKTRYPEILKGWRLNIDALCKFIESHCSIQLTAAEVSELEKMSSSLRLSIYKFHALLDISRQIAKMDFSGIFQCLRYCDPGAIRLLSIETFENSKKWAGNIDSKLLELSNRRRPPIEGPLMFVEENKLFVDCQKEEKNGDNDNTRILPEMHKSQSSEDLENTATNVALFVLEDSNEDENFEINNNNDNNGSKVLCVN